MLADWKAEFVPDVEYQDIGSRIEWSLMKWIGLRELPAYGLKKCGGFVVGPESRYEINASTCPLCDVFFPADCPQCPLYRCYDRYMIWRKSGDPEPMIELLEKAIANVS